jgi:ribose transport system permease protein
MAMKEGAAVEGGAVGVVGSVGEVGRTREPGASAPAPSAANRIIARVGPYGVPLCMLLLVAVFTIVAPSFFSTGNFTTILRDSSLPLILAAGLTVPLIIGEFDLSIIASAGLATVLASVLLARQGVALVPALAITLLVGCLVGLVNGWLVAVTKLNSVVVTIAMGSLLEGMQFVVSHNEQVASGYPEGFVNFVRSDAGPIPMVTITGIAVAITLWLLMTRTAFGHEARAVGANPEAARQLGVSLTRVRIVAFVVCAGLASLAGTLFAGQQAIASPVSGLNVLLPSIAAVFLGTAMFRIGEFNVPGTVVGVLFAAITTNGLLLLNVPDYASYLVQGGILMAALLFARFVSAVTRAG